MGAPRGVGVSGAIRQHWEGVRDVGVSQVYWELSWSVGTQGPEGYRWHKGIGAPRGVGVSGAIRQHWEGVRDVGVSQVYWELSWSVGTQGPEGV